ncbi:hypothetical protein CLV59_107288 [Chitinophaga dinghuensis]|uniref:Uncharacterized protein n=1 Tax=Chitinophaga dinghuensis TaxID=1539050 RepID=A0A327VQQ4_9BACT|nr:hypothetical protein CLV59_107288 [Chitinophaga dinghuensis]
MQSSDKDFNLSRGFLTNFILGIYTQIRILLHKYYLFGLKEMLKLTVAN